MRKKGTDAIHPAFNVTSSSNRRSANMAVQHGLGILSQWRFGPHSADCITCHFTALEVAPLLDGPAAPGHSCEVGAWSHQTFTYMRSSRAPACAALCRRHIPVP